MRKCAEFTIGKEAQTKSNIGKEMHGVHQVRARGPMESYWGISQPICRCP